MKPIKGKHCASLFMLMCFCISTSAEIAVIVHLQNNNKLDATDITQLFLGKVSSFPEGGVAIPVALVRGSSTRKQFNELVLHKTENQYKAFWSRLVFTGKASPPNELASSKIVRELVAKNPAIIGYIDANSVDDSVKVIATF